MSHPYPAEHDQQQAEALEALRASKAFVLVHFSDGDPEECDHPFCAVVHQHRKSHVIASCSSDDLRHAVAAIGEEVVITSSINTLMALGPEQREQIAAMLREGDTDFLRLRDDET